MRATRVALRFSMSPPRSLAFLVALLVAFGTPLLAARGAPSADAGPDEGPLPGEGVALAPLLGPTPGDADRVLLRARPLVRRLGGPERKGELTLVLGLPGRSTSSERMMAFLAHGLALSREGRFVLLTLEDPVTGGPLRQGEATPERRNRWLVDGAITRVLRRFVSAVARATAARRVYIVGYSSGASATLWVAALLASQPAEARLAGAALIAGSGSTPAAALRAASRELRLLFLVAAPRRPTDHDLVQADERTRRRAAGHARILARAGLTVELRELESARRHSNWHWGVISPCRFRAATGARRDAGRWPDYGRPSPELFAYLTPFLLGRTPPARVAPSVTALTCPTTPASAP